MEWTLKMAFLTADDQALIIRCLENATQLTPTTTSVSELGRFGKSGARLLLCLLREGTPLVLKLHKKQKILDEYRAMRKVANYWYADVQVPGEPAYSVDRGALLYLHKGAKARQQLGDSKELREILFKQREISDKEIIAILDKTWSCCETARLDDNVRDAEFRLKDKYRDYVRRKTAQQALSSIFGKDRDKENFIFFGASITNPLWFIDQQCFEKRRKGKLGPVHGDLHANNVIVDRDKAVHLIDFAWAQESMHVLVDYVLMECSLRFLLFPHSVNPDEQLRVDEALLDEDGTDVLKNWKTGSLNDRNYQRLGLILADIRRQAKRFFVANGTDGFQEYLAAQFLVLFGQMSYPDYNRLIGARALGLIAQRLMSDNFGPDKNGEEHPGDLNSGSCV